MAIRTGSEEVLHVEHGSLYPALHRLERQGGLVSSWSTTENKQRAKGYRLACGQEAVGRRTRTVDASSRRDPPHHGTGMTPAWLRRLFRRNRLHDDIDDEIGFHFAQEAQLRLDRGEAPDRVHAQARRDFGNVPRIKETTRDMWGGHWLDDVGRDARYALRGLKRSPALAGVAILSLAFGIGANTAIFSLADAVMFRPLPARESERLMQVRAVHAAGLRPTFSFPFYRDLRDGAQAFESTAAAMAGTSSDPVALEIGGSSRHTQARMTVVTGNYFTTLGVGTARGRALTLDDDRVRSGHPVAVISYRG